MNAKRIPFLFSFIFLAVVCLISSASAQEDDFTVGKLLIDTSHDCFWTAEEIQVDFSKFIAYMEGLNFIVTVGSDWENLSDYSVVIVMLSQAPYSDDDVALARAYLDDGGAMMVMGEWFEWFPANENVNGLLAGLEAGVQIQDDLVGDDTFHYDDNNFQILIMEFTDNCLNDGRAELLYTASAPLSVDNDASVLYYSSAFSYRMSSPETVGPFAMGATADPATHPNWHLIVTGETSHFTDYSFEYADNESLTTFTCEQRSEDEDDDADTDDEMIGLKDGDISGGCSCND